MNMLEALKECRKGKKVRPKVWEEINGGRWVEFQRFHDVQEEDHGSGTFMEKSIDSLVGGVGVYLAYDSEFFGEWEVIE